MSKTNKTLGHCVQLDHANFRVFVENTAAYNIHEMQEDENKPNYILWVSRSNDSTQRDTSFIISVVDGYDLTEIVNWIDRFRVY